MSARVRRLGWFAVVALLATLLVQTLGTSPASAGPAPVMVGFIPLPANQFQDVMENVNTAADSTLDFTVGITNAGSGAVMYYDHWEDGYEADIANPVQATTEVWGDGNTANGNAGAANRCGTRCTGDVLTPGDVFVMRNNVATPHNAGSTALFDGRDKVASTRGFTITAGGFSTPLGSVLAGAVSAYDTAKYGTSYVVPVGQNTSYPSGTTPAFETSSLVVMAAQNATNVRVDANADGTYETNQTINQGEVVYIDGGVLQGARVLADKPVQVHEGTGDVGTNYESRWFTLFPTPLLSSDYLSPVGSGDDNQRTIVYLHNPSDAGITVTPACTGTGCATGISVPAHGTSSFATPLNQAVRFQSSGGVPFAAVGAMGAQSGAAPGTTGDNSTAYDWGFTLVPTGLLTTQAILGWAPGNSNNPPSSPSANRDDDPVWITSLTATTIHVDYDGDPTTGAIGTADCIGARHDADIAVAGLASTRIHDATDGDMTSARIYTCDGTKITGAWGEDPVNAPTGSPGFDAGYQLIPTTTMVVNKTAAVYQDLNGDGKMSPGDVIEYDIGIANAGNLAFASVNAKDVLPPGVVYQNGSTTLDVNGTITSIADSAVPPATTTFPLDEAGASLPNIPAGATVHLKFRTTVVTPRLAAGTVVQNVGCVDAVEDTVQANPVSACDALESPLTAADLSLTKTQTASPQYVGDNAVFHLVLANAGPDTATGVQVTDLLPAGTTFVGATASQGSYDSTTGLWTVGNVASGASVTLDITATINATTVTNYAQVTSATAADPDSQPAENPLGSANPPDQDDEASASVTVVPRADLELTKALTSGPGLDGHATFLITLTNKGPQAATNTVVRDTPPAGSTYVSSSPSTGTFASGTDQWSVPTLAPNTSATLSVVYDLTTFPSTNFAQVISTGQLDPDSQPAENPLGPSNPPDQDDEAQAAIPASADLSVTKTETAHPTTTGGTATFVVTVANAGYAGATGVQVTDLLPAGLAYVSSSASVGSYAVGTGVWNVGSLAAGASATLTIDAVVTQPGTITNTAELTSASPSDPDSTPNNHVATEDDQASASVTTTAASIGDRVWFDVDGDGVQDAGEPGLPGVQVNILWAGGDATFGTADDLGYVANTDASGAWTQTGLPSGSYRVSVVAATLPYGVTTPSFDLDGVATASTATLVVTGGGTRTDVDFGYRGGGTIGDTVFLDTDADSSPDAGEGAAGVDVTVTWYGPNGASGGGDDIVYAATTNASGTYTVAGLPTGTFRVVVDTGDLPGAAVPIADPDGGNDSRSSVTLTTGQSNLAQDFGYVVPSIDLSVTKTDGGATTTPGGTVAYTIGYANVATATTPATGVVLTETIPASSTFDAAASTAGWVCGPTTCTFAVGTVARGASGSVTFAVKVVNPVPAGVTQIANTVTITDDHTHGSDPTPGDNAGTDTTPVVAGTVGDTVFLDLDGNGGPDAGEGLAGATVDVTWAGPNGTIGDGDDLTTSTTTDADGRWTVTGLPVGAVRVHVTPPFTGVANTVDPDGGADSQSTVTLGAGESRLDQDFGYVGTGTIGDTVFLDLDGDGGQDGGEPGVPGATVTLLRDTDGDGTYERTVGSTTTDGTGSYAFDELYAADYRAVVTVPSGLSSSSPTQVDHTLAVGEAFDGADFALLGASIGDTVWNDVDGDGAQDAGEPGIGGVTVTLLDDDGNTVATTITDGSGAYAFVGLPAGTYEVQLAAVDGSVVTRPDAGIEATDSDIAVATRRTGTFGVAAGATVTDVDAGFYATSSLAGSVFDDADGDGVRDAGEAGIAGVTVTLTGTDDLGALVALTTTTDGTGAYSFTGLRAGSYTVIETQPAGYLDGDESIGTAGGSLGDDTVTSIALVPGTDATGYDFAELRPARIGDTVFSDTDGDGMQDGGEPGLGAVLVTLLLDADGDGTYETTVATTTTAGTGTYAFDQLAPGDYRVVVAPPSGQDPTTPTTVDRSLAPGDDRDDVDFGFEPPAPPQPGSIGDRVWDDADGDGTQDPGETGVGGVTVTLRTDTDQDGSFETVAATQVTAADGSYGFTNLPPGSYQVVVTEPAGRSATTPTSLGVALTSGLAVDTADFGLHAQPPAPGSIGDRVWDDVDGDGVQDAGESGIDGVAVTLLRDVDGDGVFETTVATTTTTGAGGYTFASVPPGTYRVVVTSPGAATPSTPTVVEVGLSAGQVVDTADFGFAPQLPAPASIGDRVWSDSDHDGAQDAGEAGVNGVTVTLLRDVDGDGTYEATAATTITAGDGTYSFTGLEAGRYLVIVTSPPGMAPTTPGTISVVVAAGDDVTDADVGLATPVAVPFDLELHKELLGELVDGETATWRLTVRNNGISDAASPIVVTDTLPTGVSFVEAAGATWSCGADGPVVTCTYDQSLAMGGEVTLDLVTVVDAAPDTDLVNHASVSGDGVETTLTNNTSEAGGTVVGRDEPTTTTSTTSTTSTTPPSTTPPSTPPSSEDLDPVTTAQGALPVTGSSVGLLALVGLALLGAGVVLVALRRRLGDE